MKSLAMFIVYFFIALFWAINIFFRRKCSVSWKMTKEGMASKVITEHKKKNLARYHANRKKKENLVQTNNKRLNNLRLVAFIRINFIKTNKIRESNFCVSSLNCSAVFCSSGWLILTIISQTISMQRCLSQ